MRRRNDPIGEARVMSLAYWTLIAMTGTAAGATIWHAAFGNDVGLVFFGAAVAVAGIFLIALWPTEDTR